MRSSNLCDWSCAAPASTPVQTRGVGSAPEDVSGAVTSSHPCGAHRLRSELVARDMSAPEGITAKTERRHSPSVWGCISGSERHT